MSMRFASSDAAFASRTFDSASNDIASASGDEKHCSVLRPVILRLLPGFLILRPAILRLRPGILILRLTTLRLRLVILRLRLQTQNQFCVRRRTFDFASRTRTLRPGAAFCV